MGEHEAVTGLQGPSDKTTESPGRKLVAWLMLSFPIDALVLSALGLIPGITLLTMDPVWAGIAAVGGLIFGVASAHNERRPKTVRNSAQIILFGLLLLLPAIIASGLYLAQAYVFTAILFGAPGYSIMYLYNTHREEVKNNTNASMKLEGLTELRERYTRGEITEDQFEQRLDDLLDPGASEMRSDSGKSEEKIKG